MAYAKVLSEASNGSYGSLLQALQANKESGPSRKKRKLTGPHIKNTAVRSPMKEDEAPPKNLEAELEQVQEDIPDDQDDDQFTAAGSEDEDQQLEDPFQQHYVASDDVEIARLAKGQQSKVFKPTTKIIDDDVVRKVWVPIQEGAKTPSPAAAVRDLHLKQRLLGAGRGLLKSLSPLEKDFAGSVYSYRDILAGFRRPRNAQALREICMLHSLNHVFKTRDRVLKNNAKLSQASSDEVMEARDQGFTRPKVLIVAPTKQSCVRFVDSIVKLNKPDQQENKARFLDQFSRDDKDEWHDKSEDFRELFGGNHEEDFRIGLKFTRKTIKYFSGFYNSDIIIASPLGLKRTIERGGGQEERKSEDFDFLSSLEIAIVDHVSALQMQNWEHVEFLFERLNLLPKKSHGCDFSRVRHCYLDGHSKYLRQTIILSPYLTPPINSLAAKHLHNMAGRVRYVPEYKGSMIEAPNLLPMTVHQTFIRFDTASATGDTDARYKFFTSTMLPQLLREGDGLRGVLIFVPTLTDFLKLQNHLPSSLENTAISFGSISEFAHVKEVNRARSYFISGRHSLLLYPERAHHHFRYRLKGVRRIIFYGLPENPIFWTEIVSLLGLSGEPFDGDKTGKGLIRALFSKWEAMKLERVVGTERVIRLISEESGDTFDFV